MSTEKAIEIQPTAASMMRVDRTAQEMPDERLRTNGSHRGKGVEKDKFTKYMLFKMQNLQIKSDRGVSGLKFKMVSNIQLEDTDESNIPYKADSTKNQELIMVIRASKNQSLIIRLK